MKPNIKERVLNVARGPEDHLSESSFAHYWRLLSWPVIILLMILFFVIRSSSVFPLWREWLLEACVFLLLAYKARSIDRASATPLFAVNLLAGFLMGLGSSVIRLTEDFAAYKLFTLLTIPSATMLLGIAVSWVTAHATKKVNTISSLARLLPQRFTK